MFRLKQGVDVLAMLKASGYSTYRIAQERIMGQSTLTKLRNHGMPSWGELDTICNICGCSPWDIVEHIPEPSQDDLETPGDTE